VSFYGPVIVGVEMEFKSVSQKVIFTHKTFMLVLASMSEEAARLSLSVHNERVDET
jgi:hypothetical protein